MLESQEGGRYLRVTDNLAIDTQRKGRPFVVRWKETVVESGRKVQKKREKVLPLGTTEKEARRERDLVMVSDVTERPANGRITVALLWEEFQAERLLDEE